MRDHTESRREAWDRSATNYATFASHSSLYLDTATALVRFAGIEPGMTVMDLACGTGMVTEAILAHPAGKEVTIIATDFSPHMIAQARERIVSPNVTFHCEAAEHLSQVAPAKVDRVLCNAAFWQFDQERVLSEIVQVLKPTGKCLISIPARWDFVDEPDVLYQKNKLQWMILEEIFIRGFRAPPPPLPRDGSTKSKGAAPLILSNGSLSIERVESLTVDCIASDYVEFLHIPVMLQTFSSVSGVPEDEIREMLNVVRRQMDWVDVTIPAQLWKIIFLQVARA